jgi:hypothetical protein
VVLQRKHENGGGLRQKGERVKTETERGVRQREIRGETESAGGSVGGTGVGWHSLLSGTADLPQTKEQGEETR